MADEKKEPGKKGSNVVDAVLDQFIHEFTKPLVDKLPKAAIDVLKGLGGEYLLPIVSVALSSALPKDKWPIADRLGELISEASAELRRKISDDSGDAGKKEKGINADDVAKKLNSIILHPKIPASKATEMLKAYAEIFMDGDKARANDEKKSILAILNQLTGRELLRLLNDFNKTERKKFISQHPLFKPHKPEKTLEESVREFKKSLKEGGETATLLKKEFVDPALIRLDDLTGATATGEMGEEMKKVDDGVNSFCDFLKNFGKQKNTIEVT